MVKISLIKIEKKRIVKTTLQMYACTCDCMANCYCSCATSIQSKSYGTQVDITVARTNSTDAVRYVNK